ncbi:hypothetical protein LCGC14_3108650, partial [marine sediment metagenome]
SYCGPPMGSQSDKSWQRPSRDESFKVREQQDFGTLKQKDLCMISIILGYFSKAKMWYDCYVYDHYREARQFVLKR